MAPTTAGKTSIRPRAPAERRERFETVSFSAACRSMDTAYGTIPVRSPTGASNHGKEMRDLRQGTAVRTQREPLQGAHQPPLPAQPADGAGEAGRPDRAGSRLHSLP